MLAVCGGIVASTINVSDLAHEGKSSSCPGHNPYAVLIKRSTETLLAIKRSRSHRILRLPSPEAGLIDTTSKALCRDACACPTAVCPRPARPIGAIRDSINQHVFASITFHESPCRTLRQLGLPNEATISCALRFSAERQISMTSSRQTTYTDQDYNLFNR